MTRPRQKSLGRVRAGRVAKRGEVKRYKGQTGNKFAKTLARRGVQGRKVAQGQRKTLPVSRETLDKEIDSFMKSR